MIVGVVIFCYESYRMYSAFSWSSAEALGLDPDALYRADYYDREQMMEVEQVLTRAMQLDHDGGVTEYRIFLDSQMERYCTKPLEERGFKLGQLGEENFHLNLRRSIHFVAVGGIFEKHKMLAVQTNGSIIDPWDPVVNPRHDAQPCPLLTALWEMGAPSAESRARVHKFWKHRPKDSIHAFDHRVGKYYVKEFYNLATTYLLEGDCKAMTMRMPKDTLKGFLMKWIDILEQNAGNRPKAKGLPERISDEESTVKYVIDRVDGAIWLKDETEGALSDRDYFWCDGLRSAMNYLWWDHGALTEGFSFDLSRIHIRSHFNQWYSTKVHPKNVDENYA